MCVIPDLDIIFYTNNIQYVYYTMGTAVVQWLKYCATNRKVAGSIQSHSAILRLALWPWGRLSLLQK